MLTYRGWQEHNEADHFRFSLNTLIEQNEAKIVVSTVGLRIDRESPNPLPIQPNTGIFFETAAFHAEDDPPHRASITRRIDIAKLQEKAPLIVEHYGTGTTLEHQQLVTDNHHRVCETVLQMLMEGDRFGKLEAPATKGYDW